VGVHGEREVLPEEKRGGALVTRDEELEAIAAAYSARAGSKEVLALVGASDAGDLAGELLDCRKALRALVEAIEGGGRALREAPVLRDPLAGGIAQLHRPTLRARLIAQDRVSE